MQSTHFYMRRKIHGNGENMNNYQNMFKLTGHLALIPGGTGGLGSAIAESFLQNGADVVVCGGHPESASALL